MRYGIEHGYLHVLNMDADFSHHPRYLPDLIRGMSTPEPGPGNGKPQVDVTIGSRYVQGGGVEGWPVKRRLMSWGVNAYARTLLGLSVKDTSGAFRCYRTETLKKLDFDAIRSRGYSFQEEIIWRLKRVGASFRETPITFADRTRGTSKINSQEAWDGVRPQQLEARPIGVRPFASLCVVA
jgi:dolichol-phosphate mannosyltransferase